MTTRIPVRRGGITIGLAVIAATAMAGCSDITGSTTRFDPDLTLDRLDDVLAPLEEAGADFLPALDLAVATLEYYASARLAAAVSLRDEHDTRLLRSLKASARRPASAGDSGPEALPSGAELGAFRIPAGLAGRTLEWDRFDGYVVSGRGGAPSNGVRILLYRMDRATGYPSTPLVRTGHLDILDDGASQIDAVRIRAVRTDGPARVIADYRVSLVVAGTYNEGAMEVRTRGALGDRAIVDMDLSQRLAWSRSSNREELTLSYDYRRGSTRSAVLEGRAVSAYDALDWETFDFEVGLRGPSVRTDIRASIDRHDALRGVIRSGGRDVVRIDGYDGRPTFQRVDGARMGWREVSTLEAIWTGITDLIGWTDWVMIPADLLVASL